MKATFGINGLRRRHGRLIRAVSVFFLLFTAADIGLPQYFCSGEEVGGLPLGVVATASEAQDADTDRSAPPAPEAPAPGHDSDGAPHDEDCFCCCAHVLPSLAFTSAAVAELKSPQPPPTQQSLPSPPLPLQYHPPRFA